MFLQLRRFADDSTVRVRVGVRMSSSLQWVRRLRNAAPGRVRRASAAYPYISGLVP